MSLSNRIQSQLGIGLILLWMLGVSSVEGAQQDLIQEGHSLGRQALELYNRGRFADAIPLTRRMLDISEKVLGSEHPNTATTLNNLAELYRNTGNYEEAEPLYQRALAIREKVLGPEHHEVARTLHNLVELYLSTGVYAQAVPLAERTLAITEKVWGPEDPVTAMTLHNLALLYRRTGAYRQAEPLFKRVLTLTEKVLGPEHPEVATVLNNLALLYRATGAYEQAEPRYLRVLATKEKVLGPEHPEVAIALNNLAELYRATGAYEQAEPRYLRALSITEKVLGPEHPEVATVLNNLALLYQGTGAYEKAELRYQRALTIREKMQGPEHPEVATVLNNLAELYRATGAYGQAEPHYQRALAIQEKVLGPEHPEVATVLNNLALLYKGTGAYEQAEPLYLRVLATKEKMLGPEHPEVAGILNNLAALYWSTNDLSRVRSLFSRARGIQEKSLSRFFLTGSESRKHAYLTQVLADVSADISLSLVMPDHQPALGFQSVLMVKGRVLDAMSESTVRLRASVKPEDLAIVEELITVAQQRSTLIYQGIGNLKPEVYRQRLQELVARQEQVEADLSTRSAEFREAVAPITLAAVQAAIPKGAVLIEWYRYNPFHPKAKDQQSLWSKPRYVAYVLKPSRELVAVDVGEAGAIDRLVHDFQTGLSDRTSTYVNDVAKELYETLYKPLQQHVGDVKHLLISPYGALNLVPFAALMDGSRSYLASEKSITYLTSGRDLLRFESSSGGKGEIVIVADPDYGQIAAVVAKGEISEPSKRSTELDRGGMDFKPLPGTADEAKTLKTLIKVRDNDVLTQAQATEERFKLLHGPRILHVATHGFFLKDNELPTPTLSQGSFSQDNQPVLLSENPLLRSGLALAGANLRRSGEKDDGILTAAEVAQMDLRGTQLVVLSACETGVGDVQNGEGVYGLRRALVLAGAETQITSLWKVADEATKDLMVDYYQRLLKGEGRSEALRNAQLTMMKSKDRSHPYYWAAFVPIGNWRPLEKDR